MKVRSLSCNVKHAAILLLIPVALALGLFACDKEVYPTYMMEPDFKDYVLFPVGSYWIYNQDGNKRRDSIYLYDQLVRVNDSRKVYAFNFEEFKQNLSSSYYNDTLIGASGAARVRDTIFFLYAEGFLSTFLERNLQFYSRHAVGATLYLTESLSVNFIQELDAYTVNGVEYRDVKAFESTVVLEPLAIRRIYYARGVGVIRKELFNGQIWNLHKYKVD